jgi:hypothetical protein
VVREGQGSADLQQQDPVLLHHGGPRHRGSIERHQVGVPSHVDKRLAVLWIERCAAPAAPRVSEWARLQSNDFPLIMLWCEPVDEPEYDEDGERTVKEPLIEASAIAAHLKSRLFGITHLFENRV